MTDRPTMTPPTFEDSTSERFRLINQTYVDYKRAGSTFWAFATSDPTPSGDLYADVKTYFFKGSLVDSGAIRNCASTVIGRLWGPAPTVGQPLLALTGGSAVDTIYTASGNEGVRWYDIARGGDAVLACVFDRRDFDLDDNAEPVLPGHDPENGGTYKVLRRQTSATTNTWAWETVGATGKPFGAYPSVYIGGAVFEDDDANANALIAVVEEDDIWTVRRYTRTGTAYTVGTWAEDAVLYTAPAGYKLGRPRIPVNATGLAEGERILVVSEYTHYSILNFTDFDAAQQIVRY